MILILPEQLFSILRSVCSFGEYSRNRQGATHNTADSHARDCFGKSRRRRKYLRHNPILESKRGHLRSKMLLMSFRMIRLLR